MRLKLKNVKNISEVELNIIENKINVLCGMCGSGKSAIGLALTQQNLENYVTFGKNKEDVKVEIDPKDYCIDNCEIFNEESMKYISLDNKENERIYNIIFSDETNLEELRNKIYNEFSKIYAQKSTFDKFIQDMDQVIKVLNKRKISENKTSLTASSPVYKIQKEQEDPNNKFYINFIKRNNINYVNWLNEGKNNNNFYKVGKCPFCGRKMTESRINKIEKITTIKLENYQIISDASDVLEKVNIAVPDFSRKKDIQKLIKENEKRMKIYVFAKDLYKTIESYSYGEFDLDKISNIKIPKELLEIYSQLYKEIKPTLDNLKEIRKEISILKSRTYKIINNSIKNLNEYLEKFDINYSFKKLSYNTNSKTASIQLVHNKDKLEGNSFKCLSHGEKNLICLLLFLLSTKKQIIILDDPASSFDDNRRHKIFNLITQLSNDKTFLILSHDQLFAKYAVILKSKQENLTKKNIGEIQYLINRNGNIDLIKIEEKDFEPLDKHIENFINQNKDMPYYRKIINYRLLLELKRNKHNKKHNLAYGYLSAILHQKSKEDILEELSKKGETEETALAAVKKVIEKDLEKMPDNILEKFDYNELTNYEKIVWTRENLKVEKNKKSIKDELSEIVHHNSSYFISLNPYKYDIFSNWVFEIIKSKK